MDERKIGENWFMVCKGLEILFQVDAKYKDGESADDSHERVYDFVTNLQKTKGVRIQYWHRTVNRRTFVSYDGKLWDMPIKKYLEKAHMLLKARDLRKNEKTEVTDD